MAFNVSGLNIATVQITPVKEDVVDNVKRLATCNKASILQRIDEGEHFVLGGGEGTGAAVLSLTFSGTVYSSNDPNHVYTHTRTFTETNGVGVTLNERQLCTSSCSAKESVSHRIEANDNLALTSQTFTTSSSSQTFELRYWGTDDNSNSVYVVQYMCVSGSSFTENCNP
jgi:hypothetical protein